MNKPPPCSRFWINKGGVLFHKCTPDPPKISLRRAIWETKNRIFGVFEHFYGYKFLKMLLPDFGDTSGAFVMCKLIKNVFKY